MTSGTVRGGIAEESHYNLSPPRHKKGTKYGLLSSKKQGNNQRQGIGVAERRFLDFFEGKLGQGVRRDTRILSAITKEQRNLKRLARSFEIKETA